jgi:glycosyltransferase involved in cell wall biosynthesis
VDTSPIDASVIVCTYNRSTSLQLTLRALQVQSVKGDIDWEVLVVDNNSIDDTRSVVEQFASTFPRVRYSRESRQGLSFARNHGIAVARGKILLFTDDDVCPEPDWVQRIVDGMTQTGCDACGGYIAPVWEVQPPSWLTERFYGFLAIKTDKHQTFQITDGSDSPFGANMAFRRTVFDNGEAFDVTRGRKGSVLASGEDGEMFERLFARGASVMFFADAKVHHRVEGFRVTKRYFRRWRFQTSRNIAQSRGVPGERRLFGIPWYLFPQVARAGMNAVKARFTQPEDEAFHREIIVWHFLGLMHGLLRNRNRVSEERAAATASGMHR